MKNKLISVIAAASLAITSFAALAVTASAEGDAPVYTVPFKCGFESEDEIKDWTFVDNDGDGHNWFLITTEEISPDRVHSGSGVSTSASYENYGAGALNPDNWLISPAIHITEDSVLSFWVRGQDPDWAAENFAVYISESPDVDSMAKLGGDYTATGQYVNYTFDLSGYAGKNCYIAIRHYNVTDMYRLNVDDFEVKKCATATYANVGDYPAQFEGDEPASAWSVTVTPGTDTIENLDVKVNGTSSKEGTWTEIPEITGGSIVFAVAVNLAAKDVRSVTAVVNGDDIAATAVAE